MNEIISTISDICGILGLILSIFATSQVLKIKQKIKGDNNNQITYKGNVGSDFIGRDKN